MDKWDPKKELRELYAPRNASFEPVTVPELSYLAVDGHGDPNKEQSYVDAVEALYATSYAAKFASKRELGRDYVVAPLEGLWSAADYADFEQRNKERWEWTMLIMQPSWITADIVTAALAAAAKKPLAALPLVRFIQLAEGRCVQALHIGSYDDETPTLLALHRDYLPAHGLVENGPHHEIYLGDPRKTAPEKLRTILRQPVRDSQLSPA